MNICAVLDSNTQKFQDMLGNNAAAVNAVAWADLNFDGKSVDVKVNKAISFINKLKDSTAIGKPQANSVIKSLLNKKLIYKITTRAGVHYGTNFPEIVGMVINNKSNTIYSAYGNISDDAYGKKYNYLYVKEKPKASRSSESFMADFDASTKKQLSDVGSGMLGFALMSTDGVVSTFKVNQTVDTIVEKIARRVIAGENLTKDDIQDEIDGYYDKFLEYAKQFQEAGKDAWVEHLTSYLKNWDNLEQMVFNALKRRSGLSFKNGVESKKLDDVIIQDEESIKENNEDINLDGGDKSQGNYSDNYSLTLDSKAGLSGKLKLFLSTLENKDTHYLTGEPLFEKFDTVYNSLNAFLAGTEPDIYSMIERLKEFSEYEWVNNLIAKLQEAKAINHKTNLPNNMSLVKQFVTAMNKHYIDMAYVQWVNKATGYEMKTMADNANSRMRVVLADWNQHLEQSGLIKFDAFGNRTFDQAYAKKVLPLFKKLFENGYKSTNKDIYDALSSVGIKLSYTTIDRLKAGNYSYGSRKFTQDSANQLFAIDSSHSPITNIFKTVEAISNVNRVIPVGEDSKYDIFSNGSVKALAKFEAKYSKHLYSNSHNSGTKTVFSYTNDKFIIDRMYELTRGFATGNADNFKLLKELENDVFAGNSYWLSQLMQAMGPNPTPEQLAFSEAFQFGYLSLNPIKKESGKSTDRSLADMSPQEIIAIKLGLFYNNDLKMGTNRRAAKMFYPTMSDKTNMITIQSLIRDGIKYENGSIYAEEGGTVDYIYDRVVMAEMNRMWEVQKQTNNYTSSTNIEGYDAGSRYFYTIPELNILKSIFKRTDAGVRILKPKDELSEDNINEIKNEIKNSLNLMIRSQIEEFKENKIGFVEGETQLQFIDSTHSKNVAGWYGRSLTSEELSNAVAADFAVNYFLHNVNVAQLLHGDYAQYFKGDSKSFEENYDNTDHHLADAYNFIKPTFDNLGKRLAADLAPGYEADFGGKEFIYVTVSQDRKMKSLALNYINKVYGDDKNNKSAIDAYKGINSSDAQSWTTLDFHIDTLFNFGNKNITEKEYYELKAKIAKSKETGKDVDFTDREWQVILQPTKPLYSNNRQVGLTNGKSIGVRNYIKTSSFPLIPQLVRGTELESVMRVMEKNKVDMHVFESGYKVGATDMHKVGTKFVKGKIKLFNEDGSLNEANLELLGTEDNFIQLETRGFKIQQEVPYHDHPGDVNRGTQESKLLFSNIKHIGGFKYDGKELTGAELEEIYHSKYKQIYENEAKKLKNELFVKGEDGLPTNKVDVKKLQEILKEEANNRGFSINDIIGLDLNEFDNTFKYPLWALPSAKQYESLIISIVDNRVRKIKLPGNSFVLGSEAGFKFKKLETFENGGAATIKKYQDRIIFTSNFNGESLGSYREDGDGMKPSQVFVPMKLKGANGEFIDLMKYTFVKDGKLMLDEERLPKQFLKLFGFRIPTQGHNSMAALEIAGFLPKECGDLIIASQDLVVQMGSDKR